MLKVEWNRPFFSAGQITKILRAAETVLPKTSSVSVAFIGPTVMRRLNRQYRQADRVTDVLSFPFVKGETAGEILIYLAQAEKQAKEFGHSFEEEVQILLIHGLLHLAGYDHLKKNEGRKMFLQQKKILKKLNINWSIPEYG